MNRLKIKVCGLKYEDNISSLKDLEIDFHGFIFYPKSPRYVDCNNFPSLKTDLKKVGVFVNSTLEEILKISNEIGLKYIQLHGNEPVDLCEKLRLKGFKIIKAIRVKTKFDLNEMGKYENNVDYFLFDTKVKNYGGSGQSFNHDILKHYTGTKPFFLSGGLDSESLNSIKKIYNTNPNFYGIDLNSKFEVSPGVKDFKKLKEFILSIKNELPSK